MSDKLLNDTRVYLVKKSDKATSLWMRVLYLPYVRTFKYLGSKDYSNREGNNIKNVKVQFIAGLSK
jgi:hypothetical protein